MMVRPDDWFGESTAFDSPEDLIQALKSLPEAPQSRKRLRRIRRRFFKGDPAVAAKSRWRLRPLVFALLIVTVPLVAAQATTRNAVTADLNLHHAIGHGTKVLAPIAVTQPSPQGDLGATSNVNSAAGHTSAPGPVGAVAQVAGVSTGTGTQPTPAQQQGGSTPAPPPAAPPNLLTNPSFESYGTGWVATGGTLYRCNNCGTPEDGEWVMQVNMNNNYVGTQYGIQSSPGIVATAGHQYTASIWVRAYNSYTFGQTVTVGVSDSIGSGFNSGFVVQSPNTNIKLSYAWQKLTVTVTPKNSGDKLSIYAGRTSKSSGESFLVDNASLTAG